MVQIGKDKITIVMHKQREDGTIYEEIGPVSSSGLTAHLPDMVIFEEGITVGDFMRHLETYEEQIDMVFDGSLNRLPFSTFIADSRKDAETIDCDYVEIVRDIRVDEYGLYELPVMQALYKDNPYTLELKSLSSFMEHEMRLNAWYVVYNQDRTEEMFATIKAFSLYEVIHSFLTEISYHGSPEDREKVKIEIEKETEMLTLETQLEATIEQEDYAAAALLRDKINELKRKSQMGSPNGGHI